ncbi:glutathione S-transferase kappa 1-like [Gigantopelta aegis]|uniref:glutathione S-transferase kappa 1-like n=1 Tax=Gigantopelta aegis TaxID=1735272 RepID=UPI001B88D4DD|nr:glutathione S-transferase kappa 1-like [Gigantopelta aegis]
MANSRTVIRLYYDVISPFSWIAFEVLCRYKEPAKTMFEKGSLQAQRFLTAAKQLCPDYLEGLSRQLWIRIWSKVLNGKKEGSFFGSDRFELLAHIIGEKWLGPLVELKAKY